MSTSIAGTECRDLGLAAFIKMKGFKLLGCEGRVYIFDCSASEYKDLALEYANSCCRQHDSIVMNLRPLQTQKP